MRPQSVKGLSRRFIQSGRQMYTDGTGARVHHRKTFGFCAYPAEYEVTGRDTFLYYIGENGGGVFHRDTGGSPVLRMPTKEQMAEHWAI
ncbi:MAG: hypothetical protein HYY17_15345 [Planctomycetes bacterium]|nr:hypothetical protein [Planctomycetota bacterium]